MKQKKQKKVKFDLQTGDKPTLNGEALEKKFTKDNMIVAVRVRPLNNRELQVSNLELIKSSKQRDSNCSRSYRYPK